MPMSLIISICNLKSDLCITSRNKQILNAKLIEFWLHHWFNNIMTNEFFFSNNTHPVDIQTASIRPLIRRNSSYWSWKQHYWKCSQTLRKSSRLFGHLNPTMDQQIKNTWLLVQLVKHCCRLVTSIHIFELPPDTSCLGRDYHKYNLSSRG